MEKDIYNALIDHYDTVEESEEDSEETPPINEGFCKSFIYGTFLFIVYLGIFVGVTYQWN